MYKRSSRFGIVGVLVVMAAVAYIGLTMGQGESNPKDVYGLVFGIVGGYMAILFLLQSRDLSAAEQADANARAVDAAALDNPATLNEADLWASMAIRRIDADAARARKAMWATSRASLNTAMIVTALIFLTVPPIYFFETFVPLFVGVPLIAGIALWKSVRLLGGGFEDAYAQADRAMRPLGLSITEHPDLRIEPKGVAPYRMGATLRGVLELQGERHGRRVLIRMPSTGGVRTPSEVRLEAAGPEFEMRSRDGRVKAAKEAPDAVHAALERVKSSTRWNGVRGGGEDGAIVVRRKSAGGGDMLLDLWLAERVADALRV